VGDPALRSACSAPSTAATVTTANQTRESVHQTSPVSARGTPKIAIPGWYGLYPINCSPGGSAAIASAGR
jgi:hypothetical protein